MFKLSFNPVAGQGCGVSYSSLNQIGEIFPQVGIGQANIKFFTNITNGNLIVFDLLLKIREMTGVLTLGFIYNSQASTPWKFTLKRFIQPPVLNSQSNQTAVLIEEDGHQTTYSAQSANIYSAPAFADGTPFVTFNASLNYWVWFHPGLQIVEYYNLTGYLMQRLDAAGRVTTFSYDQNSQLDTITGPTGNIYQIVRGNLSLNIVEVINGVQQILASYTLDEQGRILTSQTPDQYCVTYQYYPNSSLLNSISQTDGTNLVFGYSESSSQQVISFRYGNILYHINYPNAFSPNIVSITTAINEVNFTLDVLGRINAVAFQTGYDASSTTTEVTRYTYTPQGQIQSMFNPNSGQTTFHYDQNYGVITQKIEPNNQITQWNYYADPGLFISLYLINKNQWINGKYQSQYFIYDTEINNGYLFRRFEISSAGRVTEFRPDAKYNIANKRCYVSDFFDVNTVPANTPVSLQQMEDWSSQQNPAVITLDEYIYNSRGQTLDHYQYATIDENGDGVDDEQTGFSEFIWDRYDNRLDLSVLQQQLPEITSLTSQRFDGLNRLVTHIDAENNLLSIQYQPILPLPQAVYQMITTYPNNMLNTKIFGNDGLIYSEQSQASSGSNLQTRLTTWQRDAIGRDIITTLPDNSILYKFYDRQNQLGFTISAMGIITQYQYDKINNYTAKILYNNTIDPAELFIVPPQPGLLPTPSKLTQQIIPQIADQELDRINYEFFDASNRKIFEVNALRVAKQFFYDVLNRVTAAIVYSVVLTSDQINLMLQGQAANLALVPNFLVDRCERYFYDGDGNKIATQDAAGYITEYVFDAANRISKKIMYATTAAIDLTLTDFNLIRPSSTSQDAVSYFFYDARSQCVMNVDAENYLTTTLYLACGLKQKLLRFATAVDSSWLQNPLLPPTLPKTSTEDQVTSFSYDLLNRVTQTSKPLGVIETVIYDAMNNVLLRETSDAYNPENLDADCQRGMQYQFDGWSQTVAEANPFVNQIFAEINANANLTPDEKTAETTQAWRTQSLRQIFDATGLKIYIINPVGDVTFYYYDTDRRLVVTIAANGAVSENTLNSAGESICQRAYANVLTADEMSELTGGSVNLITDVLTELQDNAHDQITSFVRDQCGQVIQKTDPEGYISFFIYNAFGELSTEYLPLTSQQPSWLICHVYDPRGLEICTVQLSDELITVTSQQFNNIYRKRTQYTDALGNIYQTEYDNLGLITVQTDPQKTLVYTNDAFSRVLTETDMLGNVTTHIYDQVSRTHLTIYPSQVEYKQCLLNVFAEKLAEIDALGNFQIWLHAPHGKVLVFQDSLQNLTFDNFDLVGRLLLHMDANQVQTLYEYDSVSNIAEKIVDLNGLNLITNYVYDAFRNIISELDPRKITTAKYYDRRNLLTLKTIDPNITQYTGLNLTTSYCYDGQKNQISMTLGDDNNNSQFQEQYLFDTLGRPIGKTIDPSGLKINTLKILDSNGNGIFEFDPNENTTQKFYDDLNNLRFTIDPLGGVIEKNYDVLSRLSYERKYINRVQLQLINRQSTLNDITSFITPDPLDSCSWYFYNENSQMRFKLDNLDGINGRLTETRYDVALRKIRTISYANPIPINNNLTYTQLLQMVSDIADSNNDRANYLILDANGNERFKIDTLGFVTEQRFDGLGQVVTRIMYANPVSNPSQAAAMSVEQIRLEIELDPFNDQYTYQVFDSQRNPQFVVDAECYVTAYVHDENGNLIKQIQFSNPVIIPDSYAELCVLLLSLKPNPSIDRITQRVYDNANRQIQLIDSLNHSDVYFLDARGNIFQHIDRNNNSWIYKIDTANRLTDETSPPITLTSIQQTQNNNQLQLTNSQTTAQVTKHTVYDPVGNKTLVIQGYGGTEPRAMSFSYNRCNHLIATQIQNVMIDDPSLPGNLIHPPIKMTTITTTVILDAKQQNIASQNEAGNWSFRIYDVLGNVLYTVDEMGAVIGYVYNLFNEVVQEIQYANLLTINLSLYLQTGIPLAILRANLITGSADKVKITIRDQRGDPILITQGATTLTNNNVFYYTKNASQNNFGYANPQTKNAYDAFRRCIYAAHLMDPSQAKWVGTRTWYNRRGKIVAECDVINRVKLYDYDAFGKIVQQVEYENSADTSPTQSTTLLEFLLTLTSSPSDKKYLNTYDLLGQLIKETRLNIVVQSLSFDVNNIPSLQDQALQNVCISYLYSNTQNKIAIIYEDQSPKYFYYNSRGDLIAATEVPRTSKGSNGQSITLVPLTYYGINSFGQTVLITRFKQGTSGANSAVLPQPIVLDPDDQQELTLFDNRGLACFKQDANNNVMGFTYLAISKLTAREYYPLTHNIPNNPKIIHIDEKRYSYDAVNNPIQITIVRDQQIQLVTQSDYDAFRRQIAEGPGNNVWSVQYFFDTCDNCWKSNYRNGVWTIYFYDLLGHKSNTINSATQDLSQIAYSTLANLLQASIQAVEQTADLRDAAGRLLTRNYPSYVQPGSFNVDKITQKVIANSPNILMQPARSYRYNAWDKKVIEIDALGNTTTYTYNARDALIAKVQPTVANVSENGTSTSINPVWNYGYDIRGFKLGHCDPNHHTTANMFDEAGQVISRVLAEGTVLFTHVFDALGRIYQFYDSRGKLTLKTYDHRDYVISQTTPLGRLTTYNYDELQQRNYTCLPDSTVYLYNYDVCHNMQQAFLPLLQSTTYIYDRNHLVLTQNNPDGSVLTWQRNYFGIPAQHTDLSGAIYDYFYDAKFQKNHETSGYGNHGKQLVFAGIENKNKHTYTNFTFGNVPVKNTYYSYAAGHLQTVDDIATGSQTQYIYDLESRPVQLLASNAMMTTRIVTTILDALGRETYLYDTACAITTGYDAVGNRRMIIPSFGNPAWFILDAADRVILDSGILAGGVITLFPEQGMQITYTQNFRSTQTQLYLSHHKINSFTTSISYDDDGYLTNTTTNKNNVVVNTSLRNYTPNGYLYTYASSGLPFPPFPSLQPLSAVTNNYDENGWLSSCSTTAGNVVYTTQFNSYNPTGVPVSISLSQSNPSQSDNLITTYVGFDSWQTAAIAGSSNAGSYTSSMVLYDPNSNAITKLIQGAGAALFTSYLNTNDGLPISSLQYSATENLANIQASGVLCIEGPQNPNATHYFYTIKGDPIASYTVSSGGSSFSLVNYIRPISDSYPPPLPPQIVTASGMSFTAIAQAYDGDPSFAPQIAYANNLNPSDMPPVGYTLQLPQFIAAKNQANDNAPYGIFLSAILGSLYVGNSKPMTQKRRHVSELEEIAGAVIIGALGLVSSGLGLAVAGVVYAEEGIVGGSIVEAAIAGISNSIIQGVAIGLGMQEHFSYRGLLSAAVMGGVTGGLQVKDLLPNATNDSIAALLFKNGMVNAMEQLSEMAAGQQVKFDLKDLIGAMILQSLGGKISLSILQRYQQFPSWLKYLNKPIIQKTVISMSETTLDDLITHQYKTVEALLTQSLGTEFGDLLGAQALQSEMLQDLEDSIKNYFVAANDSAFPDTQGLLRYGIFARENSSTNFTKLSTQIGLLNRGASNDAVYQNKNLFFTTTLPVASTKNIQSGVLSRITTTSVVNDYGINPQNYFSLSLQTSTLLQDPTKSTFMVEFVKQWLEEMQTQGNMMDAAASIYEQEGDFAEDKYKSFANYYYAKALQNGSNEMYLLAENYFNKIRFYLAVGIITKGYDYFGKVMFAHDLAVDVNTRNWQGVSEDVSEYVVGTIGSKVLGSALGLLDAAVCPPTAIAVGMSVSLAAQPAMTVAGRKIGDDVYMEGVRIANTL